MLLSDYEARVARQRYAEMIEHADRSRLIRAAMGARQVAPGANTSGSFLARIWSALFVRRPFVRQDSAW